MRVFKNRVKKSIKSKNDLKIIQNMISKEATKINEMLKTLKRKGYDKEYAYTNLIKRLTTSKLKFAFKDKILVNRIKNEKSITKLRAVSEVFRKFKKSKTSTVKGVREQSKNFKEGLENLLDTKISDSTSDKFRRLMENKDIQNLSKDIGGSELFIIINYAYQNKFDENQIKNELKKYSSMSDYELSSISEEIYDELFGE